MSAHPHRPSVPVLHAEEERDHPRRTALVAALLEHGYFDSTRVGAGRWHDQLAKIIGGARAAVVLLTPAYIAKANQPGSGVHTELGLLRERAARDGLPILLVRVDEASIDAVVDPDLRDFLRAFVDLEWTSAADLAERVVAEMQPHTRGVLDPRHALVGIAAVLTALVLFVALQPQAAPHTTPTRASSDEAARKQAVMVESVMPIDDGDAFSAIVHQEQQATTPAVKNWLHAQAAALVASAAAHAAKRVRRILNHCDNLPPTGCLSLTVLRSDLAYLPLRERAALLQGLARFPADAIPVIAIQQELQQLAADLGEFASGHPERYYYADSDPSSRREGDDTAPPWPTIGPALDVDGHWPHHRSGIATHHDGELKPVWPLAATAEGAREVEGDTLEVRCDVGAHTLLLHDVPATTTTLTLSSDNLAAGTRVLVLLGDSVASCGDDAFAVIPNLGTLVMDARGGGIELPLVHEGTLFLQVVTADDGTALLDPVAIRRAGSPPQPAARAPVTSMGE